MHKMFYMPRQLGSLLNKRLINLERMLSNIDSIKPMQVEIISFSYRSIVLVSYKYMTISGIGNNSIQFMMKRWIFAAIQLEYILPTLQYTL